ncbi:F-box protein At5g03100-like [Salvia miltiorrhiza]|uniref:F-box protein At5g03100-like n=1 Tax=Salvia miltiorrhiza TaxID=226208 RepID=UPI0025ABE40C|nr:F-box protein At5g03100-like [Salvia miltiorrhiza]XP_057771501.1 F-box protein At5g03100-like [Salvia miltiorrhiza]
MDRLSELPDSVIFHIFWLLPMREVVRTTILSKRWKSLWTSTPFLYFDDFFDQFDTRDKLRIFIHRALSRWDGVKVLKFKVEVEHEETIHGDVDLWVRFAMKYEVEELYLHMVIEDYVSWSGDTDHEIHCVPQFLYSCSSIKVLSITNCFFRINGDVQWNHLKSLTIVEGFGVTQHVISQILCGSPRLELLTVAFVERGESLCIRSTSLKELSIYKYLYEADDPSTYTTELGIWTPNLETLEIKGSPYDKCLLMNVSSLIRATLGFSNLHFYDEAYCDNFCGMDGFVPRNHFFGDLFGQILPSIQHVESVKLVSCCVKVFGAMIERCMNSSSPNVKSLQLGFYFEESYFAGIIEIFPLLKKLVIKFTKKDRHDDYREYLGFDSENYLEFEANLPKPFLLQLRIVEVTWIEGAVIFPFLEFLLKYASKLERIVFRVKGFTSPSHPSKLLLLASQKLLRMPKSSPAAQFIFSEY